MAFRHSFPYTQAENTFLGEIDILRNPAKTPKTIFIRKYHEGHRDAVRRLCCDNFFLGHPIDIIYRDRELLADLFTKPYLDYEPEWTLIAESNGEVTGYLLSSISPDFQRRLMVSGLRTVARMAARWLTGKYAHHPRSEQFVRWVLTKGLTEVPKRPKNAGHLHMNLSRSSRGMGAPVANRLLSLFEDMLRQAGVEKYFCLINSCPERHPTHVYTRYGFTFFDQRVTTIFYPEFPYPLYNVCMEKRLPAEPLQR